MNDDSLAQRIAPAPAPPAPPPAPWRDADAATLWTRVGSTTDGLEPAEAARRLAVHGPNVVHAARNRSLAVELALRFRNPLVLLLLVSSVVLGWTGDTASMTIILVILCASVLLDFVQEHRATRALERLAETVAARARVRRAGRVTEIAAAAVVPGDLVLLQAGDVVAADGRLVAADGVTVNEAVLTGEPYPVERSLATPGAALVRMGTSVVSGRATLLVCETGARTELGAIAHLLDAPEEDHPLERGTRRFGAMILRFTLFLVLLVLLVNALQHRPWLDSFVFAVALAVGLTPELLPMIVSVTLARGALRLAARNVIVRRASAIYALGGVDVLCTDKTGTLTEAAIQVAGQVDGAGRDSPRTLALARQNACHASGVRSALDDALLAAGDAVDPQWRKVSETPFEFARRRVDVVLADPHGRTRLIVKGAPEAVLAACTHADDAQAGAQPLDAPARAALAARFATLGEAGFRVLAVAWADGPSGGAATASTAQHDLVFAGFVLFRDPPRRDAAASLTGLTRAGIAVKIVTGDNEQVTRHVAREVGLAADRTLLGSDIDRLGDEELSAAAGRTALFCRMSPAQKTRVIRALQRSGRVVGFMGDGINDAPALQAADIGISVEGAAGVAREAADVILTRGRLGVVRDGVLEGRRTYANIMKYLMMATSSNFGNMLSMAGASLFLPFLPLLPSQILLNNLLYDVSEVAIPLDRVDEAELHRPSVFDIDRIRRFMLTLGPVSSLFDFATFALLLLVLHADVALFRTGWFVESIATQVLVIFVIRTRRSPLRSRPHPALTATSLGVVAVALALPFTPAGALVGLVAPPLPFFLLLIGLVAVYLVLAEYAKRTVHRSGRRGSR